MTDKLIDTTWTGGCHAYARFIEPITGAIQARDSRVINPQITVADADELFRSWAHELRAEYGIHATVQIRVPILTDDVWEY